MAFTSAQNRVPVALFVFNRPEFTARVLSAIETARPPRLFVIGDGPRPDNPSDSELVVQTRALIEHIDWEVEVLTCYSDANLGCGRRIATGLDWVFANTDEAILLEDDCVPDPTFFRYCEELLRRYRDDERVQMVSGCNVLEPHVADPYSYYFSRCYHIWGWATWARAWQHYDFEMKAWPGLRDTPWLERHLGSEQAALVARFLFDQTYADEAGQWDFQWVLAGWRRGGVSVTPGVNLVTNIGFGEGATHLQDPDHPRANLASGPMCFPLRHPPDVTVHQEADRAEWELVTQRFPQLAAPRERRVPLELLRRGYAALSDRARSARRDAAHG
jgi:hypothetical protein